MRLSGYDYASGGKYFITICTKNKIPYFGKIKNGKMILSDIGQIVDQFWKEMPLHFDKIHLDEYIIMPNHIHGIIIVETPNLGVSTSTSPKQIHEKPPTNWKSNSIGLIINQFKRICTIKIKTSGFEFSWQPRYFDHIIRTKPELNRIRKYIKENPQNCYRKVILH